MHITGVLCNFKNKTDLRIYLMQREILQGTKTFNSQITKEMCQIHFYVYLPLLNTMGTASNAFDSQGD
jgi:hypothetical protein